MTHCRYIPGLGRSNRQQRQLDGLVIEDVGVDTVSFAWRPAFARSLVPKMTALARDLDDSLIDYNYDRAHTGRLTQGRVPADIVFGARKTSPGR